MPIGSIKENYNEETKKTTYDINYNKLESTFNVEYTDEEKKEINKLLGVDVKRNLFLAQMYSDDNHKYSPSSQKEARYYKSKVYAALDKYSKKQPKMYEKAQEFCKIQSEKIREVKRGGHGSR